MSNNLLDLTLLLEVSEGLASQAAVDLQAVDKGGNGDEAVGLDILVELLGGGLVEDDGVLGLVLDCSNNHVSFSNRYTIFFNFCFLRPLVSRVPSSRSRLWSAIKNRSISLAS